MPAPSSKPRIESLSDLIFGLALSISALSLIGRPVTNLVEITNSLLVYFFGFLILISVWFRYTRTMDFVRIETPVAMALNVALLFFVSVEPYLFNLLISSQSPVVGLSDLDWWLFISSLYAVDLGSLFLILGIYDVAALRSPRAPPTEETATRLRAARNAHFIGAAFIFVSLLPAFGTWTLSFGAGPTNIPVRALMWWAPLVLIRGQRFLTRPWHRETRAPSSESAPSPSAVSEPESLPDEH